MIPPASAIPPATAPPQSVSAQHSRQVPVAAQQSLPPEQSWVLQHSRQGGWLSIALKLEQHRAPLLHETSRYSHALFELQMTVSHGSVGAAQSPASWHWAPPMQPSLGSHVSSFSQAPGTTWSLQVPVHAAVRHETLGEGQSAALQQVPQVALSPLEDYRSFLARCFRIPA
jgi:hypothetical protein